MLTALLLGLTGAFPAAAQQSGATAVTIVHNIQGYTPSATGWQRFSALEFGADGRVVRTWSRTPDTGERAVRLLDGGGRTLLPGLIDAHAHLLSQVRLDSQVNLTGASTLDDALARVAAYLDGGGRSKGWVLGRGWNQVLWPGKAFPTAADLDAVESDRPVFLRRIDGHAAWGNSAALRLGGIDDDTPDPVGGLVMRDANGHATGVLVDAAIGLVEKHIPPAELAVSDDDLRRTIAQLNALGLTSVHQAGISLAELAIIEAAYRDSPPPMRLYIMLAADVDLTAFGPPRDPRFQDRLVVSAVKLYADGALGSRGAAMLTPYSDAETTTGLLFQSTQALTDAVRAAHDAGFQVGVHAIGDAANRQALDAIEAVLAGEPNRLRHRIEHAQIIHPDDIERMARLDVIASMQPVHATSDKNMAEDRIGAQRMVGAYAWRSLLDRGVRIASGSDFPVELPEPLHGIHAAVTRRGADGEPPGGWYRHEAMTRIEAVTTFTRDAAIAARLEASVGTLEAGKWADFIVLDRDIMKVPEQAIRDARVLETWVAGQRVFAAPGSAVTGAE